MNGRDLTPAALALGAVTAATLAGAAFNPSTPRRGAWYASLRKPSFTPPAPAYPVAWTILDGFLAYAGYRLLRHRNIPALRSWLATVAGLFAFPALFFGARSTAAGTAASAAMCAAAATTAVQARRTDEAAALAMVPLTLWTAFATLLSEELWRRNA